jgi:hypothetical protein
MLDGWKAQMLARGLTTQTIEGRCRVLRRFQEYAGTFPWTWRARRPGRLHGRAPLGREADQPHDAAWTPIPYWSTDGTFGHKDDGTPISGADVAEVAYTAFADTEDATPVRLIVRRVRPTPGSQLALDIVFAHHAFITDRDGDLLEVEADHRRHAVIEQVIADLKGGAGLAHMPSAKFAANAAWLALAGIAYNLGRWCAALAGPDWKRATTASLRRKLLAIPGRLVHTGRRLHLRLPENWPWQQDLRDLREAIAGIAPALT